MQGTYVHTYLAWFIIVQTQSTATQDEARLQSDRGTGMKLHQHTHIHTHRHTHTGTHTLAYPRHFCRIKKRSSVTLDERPSELLVDMAMACREGTWRHTL